MNITLLTNNDNVDFGIIACRRSIPNVQRMIDYMEEALQELEDAVGLKAKPTVAKKRASATKAKARPKTRANSKSRPKAKPTPKSRKN
jgi:diacylglycerol O-acyltransferase